MKIWLTTVGMSPFAVVITSEKIKKELERDRRILEA